MYFFAEYTLIFYGIDSNQIWHLRCVFLQFEAVSDLNINLGKVRIGASWKRAECGRRVGRCSWLQSVKLTNEVSKSSSGLYFQIEENLNIILENMERHLVGWKTLYLSKVEFSLIKSTSSNLPTYFLFLFPITASTSHFIKKLL